MFEMLIENFLIVNLLLVSTFSEFKVGRLKEGQFEFPKLNGWMTPNRAKTRCERDPQCGGFTYKGFISSDNTQEFNIFFFHLLLNFEDGAESWNWVTYKAERDFVRFENLHDPTALSQASSKALQISSAKTKCMKMRSRCAGILENMNAGTILSTLSLNMLEPTKGHHTLVKLEFPYSGAGEGISGEDTYENIDRCCPKTELTQSVWQELVDRASTSKVPNVVSCNMDPDLFQHDYVLQTRVGKLRGCEKGWVAKHWTIEDLLLRGNTTWLWNTNFVDNSGVVKDTSEQGKLRPGTEALDMIKRNLTVRLFDPIARHESYMNLRKGYKTERTNKLELRQEYSCPQVFRKDLFEECQILTDYQWMLLSGPNTGTSIHLDPPFANSWNTVLQGHKLWAILPPDTEPKMLECDPTCSENDLELSPISWFLHVLPQLRTRKFYGQEVMEVLQGPGDTLYIPSRSPHAVLNLDWSLGVTENVMTNEMLLELPHKLLMGDGLLPDTEAWDGERREERMWKCLMRGHGLSKWARARMRGTLQQVEEKIKQKTGICRQHQYGRMWVRKLGMIAEGHTGF